MDEKKKQAIEAMINALMEEAPTESIEIGTPSKGGVIKVRLDFSDTESCKKRIDNAVSMRHYMNSKLQSGGETG
jgi:hypothetical protein